MKRTLSIIGIGAASEQFYGTFDMVDPDYNETEHKIAPYTVEVGAFRLA